jgi:NTE family protein
MGVRIGLVLGGGGLVGAAYHAGTLTALETDLGWDPRTADVIVGTSAGSMIGSLLRLGVGAGDLAAHTVDAIGAATHPLVTERRIPVTELPPPTLASLAHWPRPVGLAIWSQWLTRPWRINPLRALTALLPDGRLAILSQLDFLDEASGGVWPRDPLWLPALNRRNLRRVVFGRDNVDASLADAVAASCAIPGYIAPVRIGKDFYVDGGVHSATNADVLRDEELDIVVVLSPMSAERVTGRGVGAAMRHSASEKLEREARKLRAAGTRVVTFAPGPEVIAHAGTDFMNGDHAVDIVRESFFSTGRQILAIQDRTLLDPLLSRTHLAA